MVKLFIVGIPRDMDEVELVELFSAHGTVDTVTVVTNRVTGESKGYGFITMADPAGAERAIAALDQAEIDGRTVSVRFAEERHKSGRVPDPSRLAGHRSTGQGKPENAPPPKKASYHEALTVIFVTRCRVA
ncbi:RNA recognition motif domain-containing protein [Mucilaginibacter pedocola]|uniref:RRM domain-containing protein n=1 Tax=Mucilaginibacter pedocola TaxID=1792845 RepID=A0A1S9PCX4_9SPHI|nr:hypothetical protein [Mucilaginibacter pedocola]OOQ58438.1 hypothetical protein BC343_07115 [Mucilaginibacter pedocola]